MTTAQHQTFLFADLAGFTAMTEAHGDEFAADAAEEFFSGVRRLLPEFEAEEIKSMGDAVLVRVPAADRAIELAVRLISDVGTRHGSLAVRVGAHTGAAVHRAGDWFGAAVNLAARVAGAAERGEILMTETTRRAAGSALTPYVLERRGPTAFKNIAEPVEVHALTLASQPEVARHPVDPVCRMAVELTRSAARRSHLGKELVFCSSECADVFDQHPERYASPPSRDASGDRPRP